MLYDHYDIQTDCITIKAYKANIEIFDGHVIIDETEISENEDAMQGLFVQINEETKNLYEVYIQAQADRDLLRQETLADIAAQEHMAEELSSPVQTGRI